MFLPADSCGSKIWGNLNLRLKAESVGMNFRGVDTLGDLGEIPPGAIFWELLGDLGESPPGEDEKNC